MRRRWLVGIGVVVGLVAALWAIIWPQIPHQTWYTGYWIMGLAFRPDGTSLAVTQSTRRNFNAMDPKTSLATQAVPIRAAHTGRLVGQLMGNDQDGRMVAWSPNGRLLASSTAGTQVTIWSWPDEQVVVRFPASREAALAWSPDGQLFAFNGVQGTEVRQTGDWSLVRTFPEGQRVQFGVNGDWLAVQDMFGITVWRLADGEQLPSLLPEGYDRRHGVYDFALSPDNAWIAVDGWSLGLGSATTVTILRVADRQIVSVLTGHTGSIHSFAWSPDGSILATASGDPAGWTKYNQPNIPAESREVPVPPIGDATIRLWHFDPNIADWTFVRTITAHRDIIEVLAWSPDGQWLVSGSDDGRIRWWKVR